ncbi:replication initiation protein RepC [Agrobacterium tumefaciens]|uniref:Replication initiation protein RepC n=1 Tax=Agrobacterium tumefaciens TaxID=358 RepID=A0AA44F9Y6_AGRTU|nr:plasmid replication protein RepC [Agrobacterium tumefaciens]NTB87982.1 replication initiation protein RepC [Agrobacterium tumefaciens]NTC20012.1 replication initiation protein RepC [Agrobacterium tumefaciens]NTC31229.1 replication initiation protein RepC [Agrobacterium tumefaciens]NTE57894.1 replication initiation protein RepC [Agrobacterium tumefaciens]NTE74638.1 replication initiation protein RepC [Agrobacterium tumefaciens]
MQVGNVTTPFGRRPMTLALVKSQLRASQIESGKSVDKWQVFRDACDARSLLGLRDRALAVLNALLTFYPEAALSDGSNLIVFPSNAQLTARANGIAGSTLRENLAHLVDAGLIQRCDSPNGKRYARKGTDGAIETAYGFSLSPLLARSEELALMAQQVVAAQRHLKIVKERITIARRDVRKLITAAVEDGVSGDWGKAEVVYIVLMDRLRITKTTEDYERLLEELELLREEVINRLELQDIQQKSDTNDADIRQHKQNSNTESINELEPRSEKEKGEKPNPDFGRNIEPIKAFPLGMVLRACPEIAMYGPGGNIENWRDLMVAAVVVRSMLGVSPSAYQDACEVMGPENAAATMAAILERTGHISSAGGYLRDLTGRARRGEFSLGPVLMALLRAKGQEVRRA